MKVIDYCGTATVRSTAGGGVTAALVIGLLALCYALGTSSPDAPAAPARVEAAPMPPSPAAAPAPWWGPWVFGLLAVAVIALVVLVLAKLNHSAGQQAAQLGYARPMLHGMTPPPMLEPGDPPIEPAQRVRAEATIERDR